MAESAHPPPPNLVPLMLVDNESIAAVVCQPEHSSPIEGSGAVVRWHIGNIPEQHQAALLDVEAHAYVESVVEELRERPVGMERILAITARYRRDYQDAGIRPKPYVERPVQLACQNVILGLSVFAYDSAFDGLRVPAWLTCEVPHVATHEATRALTALMLCDAYASGGTMEIRFVEGHVPAALRRYARTVGVAIDDGAGGLSPTQSRALFVAVTPMPEGLRRRVTEYYLSGIESPERICYALMAQVWREIELDFLLATSHRTPSILRGGASYDARPVRMAESEMCRAALLLGMLFRRLDSVDTAGGGGEARVFEDTTRGVTWEILGEEGAAILSGLSDDQLPWNGSGIEIQPSRGKLAVLPRAHPKADDVRAARALAERLGMTAVLLVAADRADVVDSTEPMLMCPDRLAELDATIEAKLLSSRTARA